MFLFKSCIAHIGEAKVAFFFFRTYFILNFLEIRIRLVWVENLVTVHHRDKVLGFREVDDVVRIARQHVDALDVVAAHFKLYDFICAQFAFLNQSMTTNHDEKFPFGIMPMLTFGDARLADVDAYLTAIQSVD